MSALEAATAAQQFASRPRASSWVSANAGSGKTTVLTNRVARLLLHGSDPQKILCLTYTKAAAAVMQDRLFRQLGKWSLDSEVELRNSLRSLGEPDEHMTTELLARARTLFAAALETPGGLKIQTIHSFCDGVLRRFPLEAGVAPNFETLDENKQRQIFEDIIRDMAAGDDTAAFDGMAANMSGVENGVLLLIRAILHKRHKFDGTFNEDQFRRNFGLAPGLNRQDLYREVLGNDTHELLASMRTALISSGATETGHLGKIDRILLSIGRHSALGQFEKLLLNGKSAEKAGPFTTKKHGWAPAETCRKFPEISDRSDVLAGRVEAARPINLALRALEATNGMHQFAVEFLDRYDQRKLQLGMLDFDDQVQRVRKLLRYRDAAQWVLYKLDGGISHILVDEAQDTSPVQWDVIKSLSDDFFDGAGAGEGQRTIFAVGDEKQSIYSFQGADPKSFGEAQAHFQSALADISSTLEDCELLYSYRSATPILRLVDSVMSGGKDKWSGGRVEHLSSHPEKPGRIEVWDKLIVEDAPSEPAWYQPADMTPEDKPLIRLAEKVADWIEEQLLTAVIPRATGPGRLQPGDILILVQKRTTIFRALLRALKARNLPVSGADRFKLKEDLAVKDLLAALAFVATPFDELSLAAVLRSPLCGLSEAELFQLAHGREKTSLWDRLLAEKQKYPDAVGLFEALRGEEGFARPYDLLETILTRFNGRQKLIARLGAEATEGIDEVVSQSLAYEQVEAPTLVGFLAWIERGDAELKRQPDEGSKLIRVMTVHGAKGLESPLVILPDTGPQESKNGGSGLLELADGTLALKPAQDDMPTTMRLASEAKKSLDAAERHRLLYVAMTRAEHWLVVCGADRKGRKDTDCWYRQISEAIEAQAPGTATDMRLIEHNWPRVESVTARIDQQVPSITRPDWAGKADLPVTMVPAPINPSKLGGGHALPSEAEIADDDRSKGRGRLIHALLEYLPELAPERRETEARNMLSRIAEPEWLAEFDEIASEAISVVGSPEFAELFGAASLSEVPISAIVANRRLFGRIDRLIIAPDRVIMVDFKSNRMVPENVSAVPEGILRQMGAYVVALKQIWPDRTIVAAILWTRTPKLMTLPQNIVMEAFARREEP